MTLPKSQSKKVLQGIVALILGLVFLSQLYVSLYKKPARGDLGLVLDAAHRLASGASVYDEAEYHTHTKPPITTLVFIPLASLDRFWAERVWDGLLLVCFVGFGLWLVRVLPKQSDKSHGMLLFLALCLTFNSFNAEIVFGQFNWLLLMAAAAAVYAPNSYLGGACYAFSLFFKPTQIVFAPWIWKHAANRKQSMLGGVFLLGLLALIYGAFFGWDRLVSDHWHWWQKARGITPMHVLRRDNDGLPSLFASLGMPAAGWIWFQLAGVGASAWASARVSDRFRAFSLVACLTVLFTPMAWRYVYVLAFPFVLRGWDEFFAAKNKRVRWALGLSLFAYFWGTQLYNPELEKLSWTSWMFSNRPRLFGLLLALGFWGLAGWFHSASRLSVCRSGSDSGVLRH